jgi:DNA-binding GntR family transcriptional regulator
MKPPTIKLHADELVTGTVPESIADALDYDIAAQRIDRNERLIETQLAERFAVSRGSVREALRLLAQRGSVALEPRRGAVVTGYPLERMADLFAVGGMLMALAARYVAQHRHVASLERIDDRLERITKLIEAGFTPPLEFATAIGGLLAAIVVESGNSTIRTQVSAVLNRSVWRAMWEHPCDHLTIERQLEEAAELTRAVAAIRAGDPDAAEYSLRLFQQSHSDHVLATLARQRGEREPRPSPLMLNVRPTKADTQLARIERQLDRLSQSLAPASRAFHSLAKVS